MAIKKSFLGGDEASFFGTKHGKGVTLTGRTNILGLCF